VRVAAHDARVQRLRIVPTVGPMTAAAFVSRQKKDHMMSILSEIQRQVAYNRRDATALLIPGEDEHVIQ